MKMKTYYAFGRPVPEDVIRDLIENEGWREEDLTTDNLETYLWYEYQDNL